MFSQVNESREVQIARGVDWDTLMESERFHCPEMFEKRAL
jgi:hypothetical protein